MALQAHVTGYGKKRVLFLHGWLSDHHIFDPVAPLLPQHEYTLAHMDYRGYGLNRHLAGTYTADEIATDALELCDGLGWKEFQAVGHSMGGMVIQKMALMAPGRVTSAVAVTPVPASGFPIDEQTRAFFEGSADDDEALTAIFNTLTGERHSKRFLERLTRAARCAIERQAYLGYLKTWTTTDFSAEVSQLKTPIHVIGGAKDGALGPAFLEKTYLKQVPHIAMTVMSEAGHYPMLETPASFFTLLERSLNELPA